MRGAVLRALANRLVARGATNYHWPCGGMDWGETWTSESWPAETSSRRFGSGWNASLSTTPSCLAKLCVQKPLSTSQTRTAPALSQVAKSPPL